MKGEKVLENLKAAERKNVRVKAVAAEASGAANVATRALCKRFALALIVVVQLLFAPTVAPIVWAVLQLKALLLATAVLVAHTADRALVAVVVVDRLALVAVAVPDAACKRLALAAARPHSDDKVRSAAQSMWNWCCMCDRCCAPPMQLVFRRVGRHVLLYASKRAGERPRVESKCVKMFVAPRIVVHPNRRLLVLLAAVAVWHSVVRAVRRHPLCCCQSPLCQLRVGAVHCSRDRRVFV